MRNSVMMKLQRPTVPLETARASVYRWVDYLLDRGVETMSVLYALGWGVSLINPVTHTFESAAAYHAMAGWANENVWAIWFLLIGIITFTAVMKRWCQLARWSLTSLAATWAFVATMIYLSNPASVATLSYALLFVMTLLVRVRRY